MRLGRQMPDARSSKPLLASGREFAMHVRADLRREPHSSVRDHFLDAMEAL
jgi:hypothetical protein